MDNNNKINININIDGENLPMTVSSAEEEKIYRDASALIRTRLSQVRNAYPRQTDKTHYIMAMFYVGIDAIKNANTASTEEYVEAITSLDKAISDIINI